MTTKPAAMFDPFIRDAFANRLELAARMMLLGNVDKVEADLLALLNDISTEKETS